MVSTYAGSQDENEGDTNTKALDISKSEAATPNIEP